jgi:hypothetical protein
MMIAFCLLLVSLHNDDNDNDDDNDDNDDRDDNDDDNDDDSNTFPHLIISMMMLISI